MFLAFGSGVIPSGAIVFLRSPRLSVFSILSSASGHRREPALAEQIHFDQAQRFDGVHVVLRDDNSFRSAFEWEVLRQTAARQSPFRTDECPDAEARHRASALLAKSFSRVLSSTGRSRHSGKLRIACKMSRTGRCGSRLVKRFTSMGGTPEDFCDFAHGKAGMHRDEASDHRHVRPLPGRRYMWPLRSVSFTPALVYVIEQLIRVALRKYQCQCPGNRRAARSKNARNKAPSATGTRAKCQDNTSPSNSPPTRAPLQESRAVSLLPRCPTPAKRRFESPLLDDAQLIRLAAKALPTSPACKFVARLQNTTSTNRKMVSRLRHGNVGRTSLPSSSSRLQRSVISSVARSSSGWSGNNRFISPYGLNHASAVVISALLDS